MPPNRRPRRALLKEELAALCRGDHVTAMVLERLVYKTRIVEEYAEMQEAAGNVSEEIMEAGRGWIRTSAQALAKELMLGISQKTIRRRLIELVKAGYLIENLSNDNWRGAAEYRVNIPALQIDLAKLGYVLDGYAALIHEEEEMQNNLPTEDPAKGWDAVPSASSSMMTQAKLPGIEESDKWLAGQRLLKGAPRHVQLVSWLLYYHGGFVPHGSKKGWYSACSGLWEAAGGDENLLNGAIIDGQSARAKRGLTMSGPRSFVTFALDAKSRRELARRAAPSNGEAKEESATGRLLGQRVTSDGGKTTIEIGRTNGKK